MLGFLSWIFGSTSVTTPTIHASIPIEQYVDNEIIVVHEDPARSPDLIAISYELREKEIEKIEDVNPIEKTEMEETNKIEETENTEKIEEKEKTETIETTENIEEKENIEKIEICPEAAKTVLCTKNEKIYQKTVKQNNVATYSTNNRNNNKTMRKRRPHKNRWTKNSNRNGTRTYDRG